MIDISVTLHRSLSSAFMETSSLTIRKPFSLMISTFLQHSHVGLRIEAFRAVGCRSVIMLKVPCFLNEHYVRSARCLFVTSGQHSKRRLFSGQAFGIRARVYGVLASRIQACSPRRDILRSYASRLEGHFFTDLGLQKP